MTDEAGDLEVIAGHASAALARQEDRLDDQRKRALEAISAASIVFGLFGAFRGDHGLTWAIAVALGSFAFLVVVGVCLQFSGNKPWYFTQNVAALKKKRADTLAAGDEWNVHGYLADELESCYQTNRPRLDSRGDWLGAAFAMLGVIVLFLVIDLLITNDDGSPDGQPATPAAATTTAP